MTLKWKDLTPPVLPERMQDPNAWQRLRSRWTDWAGSHTDFLNRWFRRGRDSNGDLQHSALSGLTSPADDHTQYVKNATAAVTDGHVAVWDGTSKRLLKDGGVLPTQYTDEMAQDAVGGMVDASLTYDDPTPSLGLSTSAKTNYRDYQIGQRIWLDDNTGTFTAADNTLTNNTNENGHWSGRTIATTGTRKIVRDFPVPYDLSTSSTVTLTLFGYVSGAIGASDRLRLQYRWRLLADSDPLTTGGSTGTLNAERQIGGSYTTGDVIFFPLGTISAASWVAGRMLVGSIVRTGAASNEYAGSFMPAWLRAVYVRSV